MRKSLTIIVALLIGSTAAFAQKGWNIGVQGTGLISINENSFSYYDAKRGEKNFTWQAGLSVGYDFEKFWGLRLMAEFGNNNGGYNIKETADHAFRPFHFKSIDIFADAMLNLRIITGKPDGFFQPKLYFGVGYGYTNWFKNDFEGEHPWQKATSPNHNFGMRIGAQFELKFCPEVGIYADVCAEGFTDRYNGLLPSKEDKEAVKGYPGFPFDGKIKFSGGLLFHIPAKK